MEITLELVERFHEKWILNPDNGCWEWTASLNGNGYGQLKRPKERRKVRVYLKARLAEYLDLASQQCGKFSVVKDGITSTRNYTGK